MGVSTAPGRMAFTRMLSGANSIAIARVRASKPPFEAAYAAMFAEVWIAWTEETFTMAPPSDGQQRVRQLCAQEDRPQIGCHDRIPLLGRGFHQRLGNLHGGVINQPLPASGRWCCT